MIRQYKAQRRQGGYNSLGVGVIADGSIYYLRDRGFFHERFGGRHFQVACTPILRLFVKLGSMAAVEHGRRHDHETTVDHALMRGLVTAGPVMRRRASSV